MRLFLYILLRTTSARQGIAGKWIQKLNSVEGGCIEVDLMEHRSLNAALDRRFARSELPEGLLGTIRE